MAAQNIVVYLMNGDLRVSDNRILEQLEMDKGHDFTRLLPLFVWDPTRIETSGFLKPNKVSPYPEARSQLGQFWRTGPHRVSFLAESVWNLKTNLEKLGSGLIQRVGRPLEVVRHLIEHYESRGSAVRAVWVTAESGDEERRNQQALQDLCAEKGIGFKAWPDEKYLIHEQDLGYKDLDEFPDVFTTFFKAMKPLREKPRKSVPRPQQSSLPPMPHAASIPSQQHPFIMVDDLEELKTRLRAPLQDAIFSPSSMPPGAVSAHPFSGGEDAAMQRLRHVVASGAASTYKETRNGLLGVDCSTKLSAYLAQGCLTARQVHDELLKLEDGTDERYANAGGYGRGENESTAAVRYELLWRDFMRLRAKKIGNKLFHLHGVKTRTDYGKPWLTANPSVAEPDQNTTPEAVAQMIQRFIDGTTGAGLIDASQRELLHTGYTSNRARQNVASFLAKHLRVDWRYGAEWYESMLVDYDMSSNWGNWQYVAGVGTDPRDDRVFNFVKQALDYDKNGDYVRTWVPEVRDLSDLQNVFQVCTTSRDELRRLRLEADEMVRSPLKRINFSLHHDPSRKGFQRGRHGKRGYVSHPDNGPVNQADAHAQTNHHASEEGGLQEHEANGYVNDSQAPLNPSSGVPPPHPPHPSGGGLASPQPPGPVRPCQNGNMSPPAPQFGPDGPAFGPFDRPPNGFAPGPYLPTPAPQFQTPPTGYHHSPPPGLPQGPGQPPMGPHINHGGDQHGPRQDRSGQWFGGSFTNRLPGPWPGMNGLGFNGPGMNGPYGMPPPANGPYGNSPPMNRSSGNGPLVVGLRKDGTPYGQLANGHSRTKRGRNGYGWNRLRETEEHTNGQQVNEQLVNEQLVDEQQVNEQQVNEQQVAEQQVAEQQVAEQQAEAMRAMKRASGSQQSEKGGPSSGESLFSDLDCFTSSGDDGSDSQGTDSQGPDLEAADGLGGELAPGVAQEGSITAT